MQPLLPTVLRGNARQKALAQLHQALRSATTGEDLESVAVEVARRDPSLLLEPPQSGVLARTHCSYLESARAEQFADVVAVALEAGIHPDNEQAFGGRTLVQRDRHNGLPSPEMLALALRHGANPGQCAQLDGSASDFSLARAYASEAQVLTASQLAAVAQRLGCVRMLLEAGPDPLDPQERNSEGRLIGTGFVLMLGTARITASRDEAALPVIDDVFDLMRLAAECGADINWRRDERSAPAVWSLVDYGKSKSAAVLLDLGAHTDLPPNFDPSSLLFGFSGEPSLVELARSRESHEAAAALQEALMRSRIREVSVGTRGQVRSPARIPRAL